MRDRVGLQAALFRLNQAPPYRLSHAAASLFRCFASNVFFVEGNERTAFALTATFLQMHGYALPMTVRARVQFVLDKVSSKRLDVPLIAHWLEKWMVPIAKPEIGRFTLT